MIFVTGGTGLVGAHVLLKLSLKNIPFVALKRESSKLDISGSGIARKEEHSFVPGLAALVRSVDKEVWVLKYV